jgi:menaquinol-cytochrome c reductase iron-sulfur subunit
MGGAMGAVMAVPIVRYFFYPLGRKMVSTPELPIDLVAEADLVAGAAPVRLPIVASGVRDAWNTRDNVAVGSCWVRKDEQGKVSALSSVCPHLGCSVSYSEVSSDFRCPCHNSAFAVDGAKKDDGPAKRGMDPLQVSVEHGRVKVVYQRFRNDIADREPV